MGNPQNTDVYLHDFMRRAHDPDLRRVFNLIYICEKPERIHRYLLELEYLWRSQYPDETVLRINGQDFVASLVRTIADGNSQELKAAYYCADLLIFEEVDKISPKAYAMEMAYIIFDYFLEYGRCLVLSSEYLPREILELKDRNRAQFEGCVIYNLRDRE